MNHTDLPPLASRVTDRPAGACRLLTLSTPVPSVVSLRGSWRALPDFAAGEELLQALTVALLDKGTPKHDRFAIAEMLDDRGAQLWFSSDGLYVDVSGRVLRDDLNGVLELVAELLREPSFDGDELEKARARLGANIQRSMENTGAQARGALSRRLYAPAHPNFTAAPEEQLARLASYTRDDVVRYHARHFGPTDLTLVLVGDLDGEPLDEMVACTLGSWEGQAAAPRFEATMQDRTAGSDHIPMEDKQNVDVVMGHGLDLMRQDDDYLPLYLGNYVLGGNFSARLMSTVRDEMGLTYGIRSGLSGVSTDYQGHWQVRVTLSQDRVAEGVAATMDEVRRFVDDGVATDELAEKKTTITGSFKVGLATTGGLAAALLNNAERGFDVGYLDRFSSLVEQATLQDVNAAIARHLDPERLHFAYAGGIDAGVDARAR